MSIIRKTEMLVDDLYRMTEIAFSAIYTVRSAKTALELGLSTHPYAPMGTNEAIDAMGRVIDELREVHIKACQAHTEKLAWLTELRIEGKVKNGQTD